MTCFLTTALLQIVRDAEIYNVSIMVMELQKAIQEHESGSLATAVGADLGADTFLHCREDSSQLDVKPRAFVFEL